MQFNTQSTRAVQQLKTPALFVGVFQDPEQPSITDIINHAGGDIITSLCKQEFKAKVGDSLVLRNLQGIKAERVILIGLGKHADYNAKTLLKVHENLLAICNELALSTAISSLIHEPCADLNAQERARLAARALGNATYSYDITLNVSKQDKPQQHLNTISFIVDRKDEKYAQRGLKEGAAIALGMQLARNLGNLPANICTPSYLGQQATDLAKEYSSIQAEVLQRKKIEALKMGAFLSVTSGSNQEPSFIVLKYQGASKVKDAPIVLVGKGVTFDTGGISLKPSAAMDEMKFDMCGAATVLGVFKFVAELNLPMNLVGLIPSTENMPNGKATKPGDVVTSMSGQTIEVLNTDAEGRLILCDALTYAERFKPKHVIDMATLTGACIIALGSVNSGLYGNDDALVQALQKAGKQAQDRAWPMPLDDEYQDQLKSNFADIGNISNQGPKAGSIVAACFLSRFAKSYSWAHLDIAGTAWDKNGPAKGAIGRPLPLLAQFLLNQI